MQLHGVQLAQSTSGTLGKREVPSSNLGGGNVCSVILIFLTDAADPVCLVLDLRIVHDRFGSRSDPSLNGHLHYPNDIDKSLNESVTDKIRSIELTAIITPLRLSLLCLLLPVRLGGYTVNLCDFYSYRIHMSHQSSRLEAGFQSTLSQFRETDQENGVGTALDLFRTRSCVFQE